MKRLLSLAVAALMALGATAQEEVYQAEMQQLDIQG